MRLHTTRMTLVRVPRPQRSDRRGKYDRPISHMRGRARTLLPRTNWLEELNWGCRPPHNNLSGEEGQYFYTLKEEKQRRKSFSDLIVELQPAPLLTRRDTVKSYLNSIEPDNTLCETCRMVNAERIVSESGCHHLPLADLRRSSRCCRLCYLLRKKLLFRSEYRWSTRFRLLLKDGQIFVINTTENITVYQLGFPYFTDEFDPAADLGVPWRRHLSDTRSDRSFDVARAWFTDCCTNQGGHGESDRTGQQEQLVNDVSHELPTRLIDLQPTGDNLYRFVLVDTLISDLEPCTYCTLSYCWGDQINPPWITTKANLQSRQVGFDRSELPPTLHDATIIAQQLGLRYIWIDAICIVQDDDDDWASEGSRMADIYKGSQLTIAVELGYSSIEGAFNKQSTSHLETYSELLRVDGNFLDGRCSKLYFYEFSDEIAQYKRNVEYGPLSTRAWCLQESLLSSRTLYYTQSQLFWKCNHLSEWEDSLPRRTYGWDAVKIPEVGAPALGIYERCHLWYKVLVPQYSTRKLAHGSDKLVAISALAKAISLNSGAEYVAGLWRDTLMLGLVWRRIGSGNKASRYRSLSWSWASQDSAVNFPLFPKRGGASFDASIIAAEVEADQRNPFGAVTGGFLRLCSPLICRGTVMRISERQDSPVSKHMLIFWNHLQPMTMSHIYMDDDDLKSKEVICVYLGRHHALILEHAVEGKDVYRRIGLLSSVLYGLAFYEFDHRPPAPVLDMWKKPSAGAPRWSFTII
ncbi:heterokaryon incompatibility protein-domain-containing protein [Xylaria sp. FL1777]|nr:heterokaryon incompatibility protein-domain-containing protein [Xylaria sp. FL1777]